MYVVKWSVIVICKNSVEFLVVGCEDFVDIFMFMDKD